MAAAYPENLHEGDDHFNDDDDFVDYEHWASDNSDASSVAPYAHGPV